MEGLALPSKTYTYLAAGLSILAIAAPHSELRQYAELGLGVHFTPEAVEQITDFLATEALRGSRFSHCAVRRAFEERLASPLQTDQYAALIRQ